MRLIVRVQDVWCWAGMFRQRNDAVFGSKKMMVGLVVGVLSTTACALDANKDPDIKPDGAEFQRTTGGSNGIQPLWWFCHGNRSAAPAPTLKQYVDFSDVFLIGKAVERRLRLNDLRSKPFNGCWVRFKIKETLKGNVKDEIWVKAMYHERMPDIDIFSYKDCYFKTGQEYLISGQYVPSGDPVGGKRIPSKDWIEYVIVGKDVAEKPAYTCSPIAELPDNTGTVKQIKSLLHKR